MEFSLTHFKRKRKFQRHAGALLFWGGLVLLLLDATTPVPTPMRGPTSLVWLFLVADGAALYYYSNRLPQKETLQIAQDPRYGGVLCIGDLARELHVTSGTAQRIFDVLETKGLARSQTTGETRIWVFARARTRPGSRRR